MQFNSKRGLAQALMDGRKFKTEMGNILSFDEGTEYSPFIATSPTGNISPLSSSWHLGCEFEEIKPWYERDIPSQGVLCWVWDNGNQERTLSLVTSYVGDSTWPFKTVTDKFKYAEAMTKLEALKCIVKESS